MIRRFVCWLLGHAPMSGVRRDMSVTFTCDRCGALVDGDLAPSSRRRTR